MMNRTRAEMTSSPSHGIAEMNCVVVPEKISCIYVNLFLFPFPAHADAVAIVGKYLRHARNCFG